MVVTVAEVKQHLKIDHDEEDSYLGILISAADTFMQTATGKTFDSENALAKVVCLLIVGDLYENRGINEDKMSVKVRDVVMMMLTQLSY